MNITTTSLPVPAVGNAYRALIAAAGQAGSVTFALESGALPRGLELSSSGLISGTPTTCGVFTFTVRATDSETPEGAPAEETFTVVVPTASYWALTDALPFMDKEGLKNALRIVQIDALNFGGLLITYYEGWTSVDAAGNVCAITNPDGQVKSWGWNDATYAQEANAAPTAGLTRMQDLVNLFYSKLGASQPSYAGRLVVGTDA